LTERLAVRFPFSVAYPLGLCRGPRVVNFGPLGGFPTVRGATDVGDDGDDRDGAGALGPEAFPLLVLFEAGLAPAALVLGWVLGQHPLATFAWDTRAALAGLAATVPMVLLLLLSLRWPVGPLRRIRDFFDRELAPALETRSWPDLALVSVAAGVGEEMLFRGVIQAALSLPLGRGAGLAVSAAVFGLLHPASVAYVIVAGLLGAYLGAVWLVTGNLLSAIVAHAAYDFIALVLLLRHRDRPAA